jgi:DNA-binding NtrC family response regulator
MNTHEEEFNPITVLRPLSHLVRNGDKDGLVEVRRVSQIRLGGKNPRPSVHIQSYAVAKAQFEKLYLDTLLDMCEGNVSHACRVSKVGRKQFYVLMAKTGVKPDRQARKEKKRCKYW